MSGARLQQIHWLSIINSFVLVLLLTAFLAVILMRVLKNDFSRYMEMDEVRTPHCQSTQSSMRSAPALVVKRHYTAS